MLNPKLPKGPLVITDLPTNVKEFEDFLRLLGDYHNWHPIAITNAIKRKDNICKHAFYTTFGRASKNFSLSLNYPTMTAAQVTTLLTSKGLYKRS